MLRGILLLWAALVAAGSAAAADVAGTITILEGEALITRAAGRWRAAEGVRLQLGDIVETGGGAFVQVELVENTVLGIGPQARIMVGGPVRLKAERTLYALGGWYKLTNARKDGNTRTFVFRSPLLEISVLPGVVVMQLKSGEATLFAERGDLRLLERPAGAALGLRQGQTYRRTAGTTRGAVGSSPPASFLAELPRAFRDSLPLRADKFKDREAQPRQAPDFAYADAMAEGGVAVSPPVHRALAWQGTRPRVSPRAGCQPVVPPRVGPSVVPGEIPAQRSCQGGLGRIGCHRRGGSLTIMET
jgi:hypothetical protein